MDKPSGSILNSIKKLLGLEADYKVFDTDIMMHINTVFSVLYSIGASPKDGFMISSEEQTWDMFLKKTMHAEMVKSYMYLRVKLLFDPPATSFVIDSMQKQIAEFEWRLNTMELEFNPDAYKYLGLDPTFWILQDGELPEGSEDGDLAIDMETGDVWKDV